MQLEDIMKFLEEIKKFQNNGSFYTVSENDKTYSMTYEQLISYSDKLASYILENFKDKNIPVAVKTLTTAYLLLQAAHQACAQPQDTTATALLADNSLLSRSMEPS